MLYFVNWRNAAMLKSAEIILSKSIFYVKNQPILNLFFSLKNINLGHHLKKKFSNFNFLSILLLKLGPIFGGATLRQFTKYNIFLEAHSFFW